MVLSQQRDEQFSPCNSYHFHTTKVYLFFIAFYLDVPLAPSARPARNIRIYSEPLESFGQLLVAQQMALALAQRRRCSRRDGDLAPTRGVS